MKKVWDYITKRSEEENTSVSQILRDIEEEWGKSGLKGYCVFDYDSTGITRIEKIDEMGVFETDLEAAVQAEMDGIRLIHDVSIPDNHPLRSIAGTILDTPENRARLREELGASTITVVRFVTDWYEDIIEKTYVIYGNVSYETVAEMHDKAVNSRVEPEDRIAAALSTLGCAYEEVREYTKIRF